MSTIRQTSRTAQVRLIKVYYQTNVQNIPGEANNSVLSDKRPGYRFTKALTQIVKLRNYFLL